MPGCRGSQGQAPLMKAASRKTLQISLFIFVLADFAHAYQEAWSPSSGPGPGPTPAPGISLDLDIGDTAGLAAVTVANSIAINGPKQPIVLLHGAIQGGWVWNYSRPEIGAPLGVKGLLEEAGYQVFNPTLPFHTPYDHWDFSDGQMTVQKYVDVYIQVITLNNLQDVVLVGHSLAGVWMQMLLQQIPNRIASLVFVNAAVLLPGESFFSNRIGGVVSTLPAFPAQAWFSLLFSYPLFYQQFTVDLYRGWMVNSAANNDALVQATYKMMVPEPKGPELTALDVSAFFTISKPKAYIYETLDHSLSTDPRAWLLFAERLNNANNGGIPMQVFEVQADHQGMLTNPVDLTASILKAISALDVDR